MGGGPRFFVFLDAADRGGGLGGFGYMEFSWNNQKTTVRLL